MLQQFVCIRPACRCLPPAEPPVANTLGTPAIVFDTESNVSVDCRAAFFLSFLNNSNNTQQHPPHLTPRTTTTYSRYWTLAEAKPQHWEVLQSPLPSDLRYRQDLAALAAGDLDKAQHYKEVLERQQRSDRKLREAAGVFEH